MVHVPSRRLLLPTNGSTSVSQEKSSAFISFISKLEWHQHGSYRMPYDESQSIFLSSIKECTLCKTLFIASPGCFSCFWVALGLDVSLCGPWILHSVSPARDYVPIKSAATSNRCREFDLRKAYVSKSDAVQGSKWFSSSSGCGCLVERQTAYVKFTCLGRIYVYLGTR